jgi:dihydrofolate synthase / folylpolyglutamate synthase
MIYSSAVDYLYGLRKHGIKLGLGNIRKLFALAGNPQEKFRTIHVAGTNGKGSVSAISASILRSHGFKTGLFTSPHLISFTERIKVDDLEISESDVIALTEEISGLIARADAGLNPTFFEFVTAMAFIYFARRGAEWAVIETGMGGRFDATNIIIPKVSVITTISYDHREYLGGTLAEIAVEKAGIIKPGVPVVSASQTDEAAAVIAKAAEENASPLYIYGKDFSSSKLSADIRGSRFDYVDSISPAETVRNVFIPLAGEYQPVNAAHAIRAVCAALDDHEILKSGRAADERNVLKPELIRAGVASTRLRGRLEVINENPPVIIDAAHNAGAAAGLAEYARKYLGDRRIILVLGIMADKDIKGVFEALLPVASEIIFTAPSTERAESPERLDSLARSAGFRNITVISNVSEALAEAVARQTAAINTIPPVVLITGSFYTLGEALSSLGEKPVLGALREAL